VEKEHPMALYLLRITLAKALAIFIPMAGWAGEFFRDLGDLDYRN
jgi:hypothetical protein